MVKSRLDLYRAGDEAIDNDPAYEDYPDVSLQPDIEAQGPRPMVEELPDFLKKFYGQPGGAPDLADLVQGVSRMILPTQEAIAPGSSIEDRERYRQLYELEEAMAKRASQQLGTQDYAGRYGPAKKAKDIEAITGDRQTSGLGMGVREALGPQVETITELAEGKPFYELTPMQMTDAAFAVIDTIDVFGLTELARRGLTAGAKALAEKIANATTRQEKIDIAVQDSRGLMLLNEELNRIKTKATGEPMDDMLPSSMIDGERVANLTGKGLTSSTSSISKRIRDYLDSADEPKTVSEIAEALGLTGNQVRTFKKTNIDSPYQSKIKTDRQMGKIDNLLNYFAKNPNQKNLSRSAFEEQGIKRHDVQGFLEKYPQYRKNFIEPYQSIEGTKLKTGSLTQQVFETVMNSKKPLTKKDLMKKFNVESKQLNSIFAKNPIIKTKLKDAEKTFSPYDYDKLEDTFKKIKSGKIKSNLGPNAYGLNKNMTSKLLRDYEKFPPTEGEKYLNFDTSKLKRPIKEYREVIPFYSNADQIRDYLRDLKGTITYRELQDKLGATYGMVTDAVSRARDSRVLKSKIQLSKYATPSNKYKSVAPAMNRNKEALGLTKTITPSDTQGSREEFLLFDGLFRSIEPEFLGLSPDIETKAFADRFMDYMKNIDWKNAYKDDLATLKAIDNQRIEGNKIIREMFNEYKSKYPKQFKDLNVNDFLLQVAHNFPLRVIKNQFEGVGGVQGASRLTYARTNVGSHAFIENSLKELVKAANEQGGKLTPIQQEVLASLDEQAKKLGTVAYASIKPEGLADDMIKVGLEEPPGVNSLISSLEEYFKDIASRKNSNFKKFVPRGGATNLSGKFVDEDIPVMITDKLKTFEEAGTTVFKKGGPVKMAIGGDPLENVNQQQFSADPAFEGEDYFSQAVESGNLQAFNPIRLFNIFGKSKGVVTPKDIEPTMLPSPGATDELTPAPISPVERNDFPFQSFTLEKMMSPNAPNAAKPQAWADFLMGGQQAPLSEIRDSGLEQFLRDYEKFFPDEKVTRQQLIDYYQESPIGNLNVIVKNENPRSIAEADELTPDQEDFVRYGNAMGLPKHKNVGSQPLDEVGENYRNVIVQAGSIPGESRAFVESGHFDDPNIIAFTRVADYAGSEGQKIAVIQELQTDMLTSLRKEQERIDAMLKRLDKAEQKLRIEAQSTDPYVSANAINRLEDLNKMMSTQQKELLKETKGIKPFPNSAGKGLIPRYSEQLTGLQKLIDDEMKARVAQDMPYVDEKIFDISQQQLKIRDDLLDLNRALELDSLLEGVRVPSGRTSEDIARFGEETGLPNNYSTKELKLFGSVPFQKQKDYVDLILKATIKDAQSKGIEKVGIYPGKLVTQRWGKDIDGPEGKKFKDLYDRVAIQQMKSIAKKYGGTVDLEKIINPNLSDRGLTYYKRNLDGEYEYLKQDQLAQGLEPEEAQLFIDEQLNRNAHTLGDKQVIYTKEIAPGQTMDYYVDPYVVTEGEESIKKYNLVPLGPGDDRNAAQVLIEEYNPQEILIPVLTLPKTEKSAKPFFLYGKKDGGKISNDGLVSITDIYGDY